MSGKNKKKDQAVAHLPARIPKVESTPLKWAKGEGEPQGYPCGRETSE